MGIESPYLTAAEAVIYLKRRTKQALYHHIKHNRLPTWRIGSTLRFDKEDLDAWLRSNAMAQPSSTVMRAVRQQRRRA
jgi:excisionase family DNA binding protein